MSARVAVISSPFNCRWIVPASAHHVADWSYAICVRVRNTERIVNESDCSYCSRWEEPDEPANGTPCSPETD